MSEYSKSIKQQQETVSSAARQPIYTIGHSNRTITEFIDLLKLHSIAQLVDIRTIPKSRHNPQFGQEELKGSLKKAHISYIYVSELGGLRPTVKHSINDAWHNASFRNYADHMQTDEFEKGLKKLIEISRQTTTAIMCAEAVPWRCHRSLVSDALLARDIPVCEIIGKNHAQKHKLTSFAVIHKGRVTYPKSAVREEGSTHER